MYINFLVIIVLIYLFRKNPIRFSNKKIYYKLNYNNLYLILLYITIILELIQIHLKHLRYISNYLIVLPAIIFYIIIDIIADKPVIDDNTFKPPPTFLSKSYILYIILLIILLSNVSESNYKYIAILNLIIVLILFIQRYKYANCKYNLPITWSKI